MNGIDPGAVILVCGLVGGGMVLGLAAALMAFAAQIPQIEGTAYFRGLERGKAIGRRDAFLPLPDHTIQPGSGFPESEATLTTGV